MCDLYHARMEPVFVQSAPRPGGTDDAQVALPADLAPERAAKAGLAPLTATSRVALAQKGPYLPVADALEASARMRDLFAEGLDLDVARRWKTLRFTLLLGLVPLAMLAEVDRELAEANGPGARVRVVGDLVVLGVAAADLLRRTPRHPRTTAILFLAGAARFALFLAKGCGRGHPLTYAAFVAATATAIAVFAIAPTPRRVVASALDRLGVSADDVRATRLAAPPSPLLVAGAVAIAAALPVLLGASRWAGISTGAQALVFASFALFAPVAVEVAFDRRAVPSRPTVGAVVFATVVAFALTLGLSGVARHAIDVAAQVSRCADPGAFASGAAKRLIDAQNLEVSRNLPTGQDRWLLLFMNVIVVPLAEERVYRGLLQRVLVQRFGAARGLGAAAIAFGLAHLGVYRLAVYQTTLLGVSFGVAYAGGGLGAATFVHAAWNFFLLIE